MSRLTEEQAATLSTAPLGNAPNRLRFAIALAGVSHLAIKAATGIHETTISQFVTGRRTPSLDAARRLADFFGVDIGVLFPAKPEDGAEQEGAVA